MRNGIIEEDLRYIGNLSLPWERLAGKTVLISGANGFIPAYMVETLLFLNENIKKLKVKILGLVRNEERAKKRFFEYLDRVDLKLIIQDVCQPVKIAGPVDFIVHAASQASPKYYGRDPVGTLSPNVIGTFNLLELARQKSCASFLYFSSGEVYGNVTADQIPIREDNYGYLDPTNVRACYGESKRMGENMCVSWFHQFGIPTKIVRPFHTYGPGMLLDDGRVFADFVSDIVHGRDIILKSDGSATRAFCYLADVIGGIFTVLLKGQYCEAYNVGSPHETSILDLANLLIRLYPDKKIKIIRNFSAATVGYIKSPISRYCPDINKIRVLGWEPKYFLEEGFRRTIASYNFK